MKKRMVLLWGSSAFIGVLIFVVLYAWSVQPEDTSSDADGVAQVYLNQGVLPLYVTGMVEPASAVVVAAKVAGVLKSVRAYEGSSVIQGTTLASIDVPVADATQAQAQAQEQLTSLQQQQQTINASSVASQAVLVAATAYDLAKVRAYNDDVDIQEAARSVLAALELHIAQLIASMDFVDNNSLRFDTDARDVYHDIVLALYGDLPKQFGGDATVRLRSSSGGVDLLSMLDALRGQENVDVSVLQDVATSILLQSEMLATVFQGAEESVFSDDDGAVTNGVYVAFNEARAGFIETYGGLHTAMNALQSSIDTATEADLINNQAVMISDLDKEHAQQQKILVEKVANATVNVTAAMQNVAAAQVSLGSVLAPFTGAVSEVFADVGSYVTPGTPLFRLVSIDAKEVVLKIPAEFGSFVAMEQQLLIGTKAVGMVTHIGAPLRTGERVVIVSVTDDTYEVGETLTGELMLSELEDIFMLDRKYVHFDSAGPYILFQDNKKVTVSIVYDAADVVYVHVDTMYEGALVPAVSGLL